MRLPVHVEGVLAGLWGGYLSLKRRHDLRKDLKLYFSKDVHRDLQRSLSKFRNYALHDDIRQLDAALSSFVRIRDLIYDLLLEDFSPDFDHLVIRGWGRSAEIAQLSKRLDAKDLVLRTQLFRPDLAYLVGFRYLFSGFEFALQNCSSKLLDQLDELVQDPSLVRKMLPHSGFAIESIHNSSSSRSELLSSLIFNDLNSIVGLVEVSCDRELALALYRRLTARTLGKAFDSNSEILVMRLFLIANQAASVQPDLQSWKVFALENINWKNVVGVPSSLIPAVSSQFGLVTYPISNQVSSYRLFRGLVQLTNVQLVRGGTLICGDKLLQNDYVQSPFFDFTAGRWDYVAGTSANLRSAAIRIASFEIGATLQSGIVLTSRADTNWYHWLIETLPRIVHYDDLIPKDIPVVVNKYLPSQALEALRLCTNRKILPVEPGAITDIARAYILAPCSFHPDSSHFAGSTAIWAQDTEMLDELRNKVQSKLPRPEKSKWFGKKVFLTRSNNNRSIINGNAVSVIFKLFGIPVADTSKMSFQEQVELFQCASAIYAAGGAVMANFMFSKVGQKITLLVSEYSIGYRLAQVIASIGGGNVRMLIGRAAPRPLHYRNRDAAHLSFRVPLIRLFFLLATGR